MSRSYQKSPYRGCNSPGLGKYWKKKTNRRMRHHNRVRLLKDPEGFIPMIEDEAGDVWDSHMDHRYWFGDKKNGKADIYFPFTYWWEDGIFKKRAYTCKEIEEKRSEQREDYKRWMRK